MMRSDSADYYIGLMSGTSMDSIDAVLVDFSQNTPSLLGTHSQVIDAELKQQLLHLCDSFDRTGKTSKQQELKQLDEQLAHLFSSAVLNLLKNTTIKPEQIKAIGSHGQTVFHLPPQKKQHAQNNPTNGFSLQIGDPKKIAQLTGIPTVGNFRNDDMQVGGQGAPLVPAFHQAVFSSKQINRCIVNIGGMANITYLPVSNKTIGFDTGPGNVLMDLWIKQQQNKDCDEGGSWAKQGSLNQTLLNGFLNESFFNRAPPKSTGRELFNHNWLQQHLDSLAEKNPPADIQRTLCELTAITISQSIKNHTENTEEIIICGGGAHNLFLMELLQKHNSIPVMNSSSLGTNPDWVEAMAFAWLAKQNIEGKTGNLPAVTGATQPVVLGELFHPS